MSSTAGAGGAAIYEKAGQRYPTPSPGSGDRVFYASLYEEKGDASPMALIWLVEHGCFPAAEATKKYDAYLKAKGKERA